MRKFLSYPIGLCLLLPLLLLASACERRDAEAPGESGESGDVVHWPELSDFDELAFVAEGHAKVGDVEALREMRRELLEAGRAVSVKSTPENVRNPDELHQLLGDLSSLVNGLAGSELDDENLVNLVLGMHPVVSALISASGMPHIHTNEGPNGGYLHPVFDDAGGKQVGTAEIKLHDDAGDLEVWLTRGGRGGEPWRLPLDTTLSLEFSGLGKNVALAVRDRERNEDESGAATIHEGATAYFIFPGDTGADASWLMGEDFAAKAELRFEGATTGSFVLRPHVHHEEEG